MSNNETEYDVAIVGASIAGCTAAMLFGRAGLRVALLERNHNRDSHKAMCGHFILGGAKGTLDRLGIWDRMLAHGAEMARTSVWVGTGWVTSRDDGVPPVISMRRRKLDPLLREMAAATPGVDLLVGNSVSGLIEADDGRIAGVRTTTDHGERATRARLVVGADGHRSPVARLAGARESVAPNERFLWWAYYRGVADRPAGTARSG